MNCARMLVCGLFLLLLAALQSRAQQSELRGSVHDTAGASVPGANVTIDSTGAQRSTQTDQAGRFFFAHLEPSHGTISVSAPGFDST